MQKTSKNMHENTLYRREEVLSGETTCITSGRSWGFGALGPAIVRGPLQGCDPTFPSWGLGGAASPMAWSGADPPEANAFWQQYFETWLKIRYIGRRLHP